MARLRLKWVREGEEVRKGKEVMRSKCQMLEQWEEKPGHNKQHKLLTEKGRQLEILTSAPTHHLICRQG